jgi:hypothetical protein
MYQNLMMKKLHISLLLVLFSLVHILFAQAQIRQPEKKDNFMQQKINFFTENLQLTPTESGQFWPVYNDYQNRRDKITRDRNTLMKYYESNKNNMTEDEAGELISKYVAFQQEETRLLETYTKKFQEFLPSKKVMRIYIVELDFKKWLLQNLRQNKASIPARD